MKLRARIFYFSAGRPVAILNEKFAKKATIHADNRIFLKKNNKKIIAVVDIAREFLKENEIIVSTEVAQQLNLKENDFVELKVAPKPQSISYIMEKLKGKELNKEKIERIVRDIVENALTETEIAYFVSSVYTKGMSFREIENLTKSIVNTGKKLNFKNEVVDKHSIGGVPGRTTPIIVSICAVAGLTIPKTSSRAITSASGTADAMECLCKVDFSAEEIKKIVSKTNACMVWGGSLNLAPADDKIIQVERLMDLDPEPQLLASIISKKLAVGAKHVVIDIPYGKYTKINYNHAKKIEKRFQELGKHFKIKIKCSLNKIEEPLGYGIGPVLEILDVIKVLKREDSCYKLEKRAIEIASILLEISGKAKKGEGKNLALKILDSGKAWEKFKDIVKAQKGNAERKLKTARFAYDIISKKSGRIKEINTKALNYIARLAGCPLDKSSGIYLYKHLNQEVKKGEKIITIYSETKEELKEAIKCYNDLNPIIIK